MVLGVIAKDFVSAKDEGFFCAPAHVARGMILRIVGG